MKIYLRRPEREQEEGKSIGSPGSITIELGNYDAENDPEGIFDTENVDEDTCYSFETYDEYRKFMQIFDAR